MTSTRSCPGDPVDALSIGILIEVDGTRIVAELDHKLQELSRVYHGRIYPIGQFGSVLKIHFGRRILYAYVSRLRMKSDFDRERGLIADENADARVIEADLFGEAEWVFTNNAWRLCFERGVSTFPLPTQRVFLTPQSELADVVGRGTDKSIHLGDVVGSGNTPFFLDMDELLGKHTAVLGSTGAGKSGTLAAILHGILDHGSTQEFANWHPTVVILDPHNEYHTAFPGNSRLSPDEGNLSLPYWLLDFEETVALIIGRTEYVATSQSNILKTALTKPETSEGLCEKRQRNLKK